MLLHDAAIRERSMIDPFSEGVTEGVVSYGLTHAGYDLRLSGEGALLFKGSYRMVADPRLFANDEYRRRIFDPIAPEADALPRIAISEAFPVKSAPEGVIWLPPAPSYLLARSFERIVMPSDLKGRCVGKSTYARCGVIVNTTPLEPGWQGHLTIEIANSSPCPVALLVGQGIAQLEFEQLTGAPERLYTGKKYDQQVGVVPARVR